MNLKTKSFCCCLAIALVAIAGSVSSAQTRVNFARGATTATVRGYLRGIKDHADFMLRLKAGQHIRIEIRGRGPTRGVLIFPSGKQDGGPGGVIFDDKIDETGDFQIRVTESSMAEAWRGNFTVVIDATSSSKQTENRLDQDLTRYVDKYPSDLFRGVPTLKTRLRVLLGANYKSFFDRLQTEMPIERDGNAIVARGCMAHSCGVEEAILVINLDDGKLHGAIRSSRYGGRFRTFSENKASIPTALNRAMQGS